MTGRSCDSRCIFSGARGEVCCLEPLHLQSAQKNHPLKDVILVAMATLSKVGDFTGSLPQFIPMEAYFPARQTL